MGALQHLVRAITTVALGTVLSAVVAAPVKAEVTAKVQDSDLDRLKSLATTLRMEREAADAFRRKDTRGLQKLATEVKASDAAILSVLPLAVLPRSETRTDAEFTALALKLGACHYAGLTLRLAVIGMAEGRTPARIRKSYIDATPPVMTDQFAAHVQRCELIERVAPSVRLIGSSCLSDGRNCRESER